MVIGQASTGGTDINDDPQVSINGVATMPAAGGTLAVRCDALNHLAIYDAQMTMTETRFFLDPILVFDDPIGLAS
ncbi:MAG: hypothetical protein ACKV2O_07660 [Acidimicrobiales bacterium]